MTVKCRKCKSKTPMEVIGGGLNRTGDFALTYKCVKCGCQSTRKLPEIEEDEAEPVAPQVAR